MRTTQTFKTRMLLSIAVATAALAFTSAAAAETPYMSLGEDGVPEGFVIQQNKPGVTPTDLARAVPWQSETIPYLSWGATKENAESFTVSGTDGHETAVVRNDRRIARELRGHDVIPASTQATSSSGFDGRDLALGFGLGLLLGTACVFVLAMTHTRIRIAHS